MASIAKSKKVTTTGPVEKFFILIVNQDADSINGNYQGRSRAYPTREAAIAKAQEYIGDGKSKYYYICECVAKVRVKPVDTEVIEVK